MDGSARVEALRSTQAAARENKIPQGRPTMLARKTLPRDSLVSDCGALFSPDLRAPAQISRD